MLRDLGNRVLRGDSRAVAHLLSLVEDEDKAARSVLRALYRKAGRAHIVGITGTAGSGKSTLIARATAELRKRKKEVGVLMVDPTSPFTGGALLGDRLRMRGHFQDRGVFIRSLATRGGRGGISAAVRDAATVLDAAGKDIVFVETIGIGQDQVEVSTVAQTTVVVINPWSGDEVQGMKAGLLEIGDILVVNKADLAGAEETFRQLKTLFEAAGPRVIKVSALTGEGIPLLVEEIENHRAELLETGEDRKRNLGFCRSQLLYLLQERILSEALRRFGTDSFEDLLEKVARRDLDPYSAADRILRRWGEGKRVKR